LFIVLDRIIDTVPAILWVFVEFSAVIGSYCGRKKDKGGEGETHDRGFTQLYSRMTVSVVVEIKVNEVVEMLQRKAFLATYTSQ
jgi:hypothetical protein